MENVNRKNVIVGVLCATLLAFALTVPSFAYGKEAADGDAGTSGAATEVSVWQEKSETVVNGLPKTGDDLLPLAVCVGAAALLSGGVAIAAKRGESNDKTE